MQLGIPFKLKEGHAMMRSWEQRTQKSETQTALTTDVQLEAQVVRDQGDFKLRVESEVIQNL